ncbi:MAG: non-lysosomal glucosylceramidase [Planctomycetes bacterium]|nr:non-lysosomal glucosylceramidase [Planctomycetota bacterium]
MTSARPFTYRGPAGERICWPLGGVGAPLLALSGSGAIDHIANRHRPEIKGFGHAFAALAFPGSPQLARVIEGQVPAWRVYTVGRPGSGVGWPGYHQGLPRLRRAEFVHRFPFAEVAMDEPGWPVRVQLRAWSPFVPGDADASGLPLAVLDYRLVNPGRRRLDAVFSFHCFRDLLRARDADDAGESIRRSPRGFVIDYPADPALGGPGAALAVEVEGAMADCAWFRGGHGFDSVEMLWRVLQAGAGGERPPHADGRPGRGASLWLPLVLPPRGCVQVRVRILWHEPVSGLRCGPGGESVGTYRPRYASLHPTIDHLSQAVEEGLPALEMRTQSFSDTLHGGDIPAVVLAAVTANLPILRSPTVLRQHDGRLWTWEGSAQTEGSCHGSCTHVLNYAQAVAHLFPALERGLREDEFGGNQDERGHQAFRTPLPIRPADHGFHAAADGQLGGLVKLWRDWQMSGDDAWLRRLWPRVRASLDYCIATWDPDGVGALVEPHHNTYDIELWGPDGMCGSVYAAALKAGVAMADHLGEDAARWRDLMALAVEQCDRHLHQRGRYVQRVVRATARAGDPLAQGPGLNQDRYSPEALVLVDAEGPRYQYGEGCLSDGVLGAWLADAVGLGSPLDRRRVRSHLAQVHRCNLRHDLRDHVNPHRAGYAVGHEGGLLLCTWPEGNRPAVPFFYADEVWTGVEHQVAAHCVMHGLVREGLDILRTCRRRYDGRRRNPFDEYECGHWYMRALASWSLLHAFSGVRYSAVEKTLWIAPALRCRPFRAPVIVGADHGLVTLGRGWLEVDMRAGALALERVVVDGRAHPWPVCIKAGTPGRLRLAAVVRRPLSR